MCSAMLQLVVVLVVFPPSAMKTSVLIYLRLHRASILNNRLQGSTDVARYVAASSVHAYSVDAYRCDIVMVLISNWSPNETTFYSDSHCVESLKWRRMTTGRVPRY